MINLQNVQPLDFMHVHDIHPMVFMLKTDYDAAMQQMNMHLRAPLPRRLTNKITSLSPQKAHDFDKSPPVSPRKLTLVTKTFSQKQPSETSRS